MAHVLFITHWFPTVDNPVSGVFIREHARAVALFHQVSVIHVVGIRQARPGIEKVSDEKLTVYRLGYPRPALPKTGWLYRLRGTNRIVRELIQNNKQPVIIHAHVYSSSDLAYLMGSLYHCPAVLSEHAHVYPWHLLTASQLSYYRFFMNKLRLIMPVSRDLQGHMQQAGFRGPFQVIPNTVDTLLFHPDPSRDRVHQTPLTILNVAMHHPIKGVNLLIEAVAALRAKNLACRLWIVGDGPEHQRLQELTNVLHLSSHVSFLGIRTRLEVAELMRAADLFALTSLYETQSVALIEAMASGLPVTAPAVGGVPEIIKPDVGALFEPGNVADLVEKLTSMIDHIHHYSPAASAEYAAETFGLQAVGQRFANVYQNILQNV